MSKVTRQELDSSINKVLEDYELEKFTPLLAQNSSIFTTGTGVNIETGVDVLDAYIANVINGQISDIGVKGRTYSNGVKNGNFANGTTDWLGSTATISASNNTLFVTANGNSSGGSAYTDTTIQCQTNKKCL